MNIISVDLNWNPNPSQANRIAATVADKEGRVRTVIGELSDSELFRFVNEIHLKKNTPSLILLDIPIEGCKYLKSRHFRPVDLMRNGFPLLPSSKAGQRGSLLKKKIQAAAGKSAKIYEVYPYAVYKFLSYLSHKGVPPPHLRHGESAVGTTSPYKGAIKASVLLDDQFRTFWPPKYKRERNKRIRVKNMRHVLSLLMNPQIGLAFSQPLQAPSIAENLSTLTDKYDACLGAIVGIHLANKSPFAKIVGDKDSGEILLLADRWLVKNLKKTHIRIR